MALAQRQPNQEVAPIVKVVLLVVTGDSQDGKIPFNHQGRFKLKEPTILRVGVKKDQPLLLKEQKTEIVMPKITRTLTDVQTFNSEHNISLVRINIQELIDKMGKRGRLIAGDSLGVDVVLAQFDSSVIEGFRRERIALMTFHFSFMEIQSFYSFSYSAFASIHR